MSLTVLFLGAGILASLGLIIGGFFLIRALYLASRIGAFRTLLRRLGPLKWRRGYARYGQFNMAWSPLISLSLRPELLLPRAQLEVIGEATLDSEDGTTILRLRCRAEEYELILSTGDYNGLVSWIESSPPQEAPF